VLQQAAEMAGLSLDEMCSRLEQTPEGEELLVKTLQATSNVATMRRLILLSQSLANGASESAATSQMTFELQLMIVVTDLSEAHFSVLEAFTTAHRFRPIVSKTPLHMGGPVGVEASDVKREVPDTGDLFDALLSGLQRHGLVRFSFPKSDDIEGPVMYVGAGSEPSWILTDFGSAVLDRLKEVGSLLKFQAATDEASDSGV
jgi:hypothetical protein